MAKRIFAPPPFEIIVGYGNRHGFRYQTVMDEAYRGTNALIEDAAPTPSAGTITVSDANFSVVEVYARGGFTLAPPLTAGTTITINGNPLTGIPGARTPGNDDFDVDAVDIAAEIAAAINDGANSFVGDVSACAVGDFVGIQAVTIGTAGNAITLATNNSSEVFLSSSTLLGGGFAPGQASLFLGPYTLLAGYNWYPVEGDATATATALATAIDNLPGFSASSALAVVTVLGPTGPESDARKFEDLYKGVAVNFTLSPDTGFLGGGGPAVVAPEIF